MIRLFTVALCTLFLPNDSYAEIKRWRVGDDAQPWSLRPVSGRLDLGRSWVVEIIVDDDGDGMIDQDPVELHDNDGDGLFNEDPTDPQCHNTMRTRPISSVENPFSKPTRTPLGD